MIPTSRFSWSPFSWLGAPAAVVLLLGLAACGRHGDDTADGASALAVTPVGWNPSNADVGQVAAVVEKDQTLFVFGSKGVVTLTGGAIVSTDPTITSWRDAASLPSPDGASTWLVGVDGGGRLQRIFPDRAPADVSGAYGLGAAKVTAIAAASATNAPIAFLLEDGLAIDDGKNVTHYAAATPRALAASDHGVAFADGTGVRVFARSQETDLALADATLVAWTGDSLVFATPHQVYRLANGQTELVYDAGPRTIRQLAAAGAFAWLAIDDELAQTQAQGGGVVLGSGPTLGPGAKLAPSSSGDVWVLDGGQLARYSGSVAAAGPSAAPSADEGKWTATVQPIYASVCSNCHSPAGSGRSSANLDLSTYEAWNTLRSTIYGRVVAQAGSATAMPPPTSGLTLSDAQRSAIAAWAQP